MSLNVSGYAYKSDFFDFVDISSGKSARAFIGRLDLGFKPESVIDVGCGRGVWLSVWRQAGVSKVVGLDGEYVDKSYLKIPTNDFISMDISRPFNLGTRFDLAECLEVAEHINESLADTLILNLVNHADIIMFSAATPGQGGEHHINERPLEYWADKFRQHGYDSFDFVRKAVDGIKEIEPWYRYNTLIFANGIGQSRLGDEVRKTLVGENIKFKDYSTVFWKIRCLILRILPSKFVSLLAVIKHKIITHFDV